MVTVAEEELPPTRLVGLSTRLAIVGAVTVSFAEREAALVPAVIVAVTVESTATVGIVKLAVVLPPGTVIEAGGVTLA